MNNFRASSILYFDVYYFTDTGESANHFALVLLPSCLTEFKNSLYCAVITSKDSKSPYTLLLKEDIYKCFCVDSFVCFDRIDLSPLSGLSSKKQPVGFLAGNDKKEGFKIIKKVFYNTFHNPHDKPLIATIVREWKKIL